MAAPSPCQPAAATSKLAVWCARRGASSPLRWKSCGPSLRRSRSGACWLQKLSSAARKNRPIPGARSAKTMSTVPISDQEKTQMVFVNSLHLSPVMPPWSPSSSSGTQSTLRIPSPATLRLLSQRWKRNQALMTSAADNVPAEATEPTQDPGETTTMCSQSRAERDCRQRPTMNLRPTISDDEQ